MTDPTTKGYNAVQLADGFVGLSALLRGDAARDFMAALNGQGQAPAQGKPKQGRP